MCGLCWLGLGLTKTSYLDVSKSEKTKQNLLERSKSWTQLTANRKATRWQPLPSRASTRNLLFSLTLQAFFLNRMSFKRIQAHPQRANGKGKKDILEFTVNSQRIGIICSAVNFKKQLTEVSSTLELAIWSRDPGQRISCFDRCQLIKAWMSNVKDVCCKLAWYWSHWHTWRGGRTYVRTDVRSVVTSWL